MHEECAETCAFDLAAATSRAAAAGAAGLALGTAAAHAEPPGPDRAPVRTTGTSSTAGVAPAADASTAPVTAGQLLHGVPAMAGSVAEESRTGRLLALLAAGVGLTTSVGLFASGKSAPGSPLVPHGASGMPGTGAAARANVAQSFRAHPSDPTTRQSTVTRPARRGTCEADGGPAACEPSYTFEQELEQFITQSGIYDRYYRSRALTRGGDPIYLFFDDHPEETLQFKPTDNGWLEHAVATWIIDRKQRQGLPVDRTDIERQHTATLHNVQDGIAFMAVVEGITSASASVGRVLRRGFAAAEDALGLAKGTGKGPRKSPHAERRQAEGKPVDLALSDARHAKQSQVFIQPDGRYVVRYRGTREHVFEPDGTIVTSIPNRTNAAHRVKVQRGERQSVSVSQYETFQESIK